MAVAALLLSLALAHVRVVESADLSDPDASRLVAALEAAIERRIGAENAAKEEVKLQLFGGLTRVRLIGDRAAIHAGAEVVLEDSETWTDGLDVFVRELFPDGTWSEVQVSDPLLVATSTPAAAPKERSVAPWILAGASVVALGVGFGFGASSNHAATQSQIIGEDYELWADRKVAHAITADIFFALAAVGAGTALALWFTE